MRYSTRSPKTGRFITCAKNKSSSGVVAGRLYGYKGTVVRAFGQANGKRLVCFHKSLTGLVPDSELTTVSKEAVARYLAAA